MTRIHIDNLNMGTYLLHIRRNNAFAYNRNVNYVIYIPISQQLNVVYYIINYFFISEPD